MSKPLDEMSGVELLADLNMEANKFKQSGLDIHGAASEILRRYYNIKTEILKRLKFWDEVKEPSDNEIGDAVDKLMKISLAYLKEQKYSVKE